jgi:chromosome condensin MukBEF MukE localization factor
MSILVIEDNKMSGGHYQHAYFKLERLADEIEADFLKGVDSIPEGSDAEKFKILFEVKSLIRDLRIAAIRAKELEWFMSADTGAETYLKRLGEILYGYLSK